MDFNKFGGPDNFVALFLIWLLTQINTVQSRRLACYEVGDATKDAAEIARSIAQEDAYENVFSYIEGLLTFGNDSLITDAISSRYEPWRDR